MRDDLLAMMRVRGGVGSRMEALRVVGSHVIDKALSSGAIIRAFPSVYVVAELAGDADTLDRAALAYVPDSALSHITALRVEGIPHHPLVVAVHLTTGPHAHVRASTGVAVHRRQGFDLTQTVTRRGLRLTRLDEALVQSWPLLVRSERRGPAIVAVRERRTTAARLLAALKETPRIDGRAEMTHLFELLALGCHSELELWGHDKVFNGHGLPPARLQHIVHTRAGRFVLDRAYDEEMVGAELDGAAWHGSTGQRERDVRRDAALAAEGWLIVRFTHHRLTADPAGCRDELRQILAVRR